MCEREREREREREISMCVCVCVCVNICQDQEKCWFVHWISIYHEVLLSVKTIIFFNLVNKSVRFIFQKVLVEDRGAVPIILQVPELC